MVLSSVETNDDNEVVHLQYQNGNYTAESIVTYGMDASTILETYMGKRSRVAEVEEKLKHLFTLIDEEKFAEAKSELGSMREKYSDTIPSYHVQNQCCCFLKNRRICI